VIEYITISTLGNSTTFGQLTQARYGLVGCSSSTRGVFAGGVIAPSTVNTIDYVTIASVGNAIDFGDLTSNYRPNSPGAVSNETRGVIISGYDGGNAEYSTKMQLITIASTGNSSDFGTSTTAVYQLAGCSSTTRGVTAAGELSNGSNTNVIQYITIASTGNAIDFGDLTVARRGVGACSSSTRGVFAGGWTSAAVNVIDYITIASVGNAIDFGDLSSSMNIDGNGQVAGTSSQTRGVFCGGTSGTVIEYIEIATTGNSSSFGTFLGATSTRGRAACSSAHGGL
jgi:hypothetical protein